MGSVCIKMLRCAVPVSLVNLISKLLKQRSSVYYRYSLFESHVVSSNKAFAKVIGEKINRGALKSHADIPSPQIQAISDVIYWYTDRTCVTT